MNVLTFECLYSNSDSSGNEWNTILGMNNEKFEQIKASHRIIHAM
jgi:hypothetical protein